MTVGMEFFCYHRDRPDTARAILTPDRYADIEVHNWQFGGRPT